MRFPSPLRYPGGKSVIFPFASDLIKENQLVGINYAEPFAGGAGLALRLLYDEYVSNIHINDYDPLIYNFWDNVVNYSQDICDWIETIEVNIDSWKHYKYIYENSENFSTFDRAKAVLFLNRTNVSGVLKGGGVIGGINQQGTYKLDARFNKQEVIKKIEKIGQFRKRINVTNLDGNAFIKSIEKRKEDFLFYIDPPYYIKGAKLYMNSFKKEDHVKLMKTIRSIKKRWFLSYDAVDFIQEMYSDFTIINYKLQHSTSNKNGNEILIFPPNLAHKNSISFLKINK